MRYKGNGSAEMTDPPMVQAVASPLESMVRDSSATVVSAAMRIPFKRWSPLDAVLPRTWSHGNPVDIIGDAPPERYVDALRIALADSQSDAVLVLHAPTAIVPSDEIATACIDVLKAADNTVLACWLGGDAVATARDTFAAAGVPNYDTPEGAIQAFLQLVEYHRSQAMLLEVPAAVDEDFRPDIPPPGRSVRRCSPTPASS